ncbi:hypothetical protein L1887_08343 [Cichorium endivia]|nr:hypothetical protein L1887_08343 [Cichorium endivia]
MDLGTIKSKFSKNEYESPLAFASDLRLTFQNAMVYNGKGSEVFVSRASPFSVRRYAQYDSSETHRKPSKETKKASSKSRLRVTDAGGANSEVKRCGISSCGISSRHCHGCRLSSAVRSKPTTQLKFSSIC